MTGGARREPNERFMERLRDEMQARKITSASGLAAALTRYRITQSDRVDPWPEINKSTVIRWLEGFGDPSGPYLGLLADFFGCSMDYLWDRVDERTGLYGADAERISAAAEAMTRAAGELHQALQGTAR